MWTTKYVKMERKKKTVKWFETTRLKEGPGDKGEKKDRSRRWLKRKGKPRPC